MDTEGGVEQDGDSNGAGSGSDQPHKTPVASTWTTNFLTREGEGRKAMGDWQTDKTISWKARRRLLQTNADTFPCEARL